MTAYDLAAWTDFANTVAGGAAALAGLLIAEAVSLWLQRNRFCRNRFRRSNGKRVGASRRDQALTLRARRASTTTIITTTEASAASRISPVMSPRSRVR
jgi:hypothetical protein